MLKNAHSTFQFIISVSQHKRKNHVKEKLKNLIFFKKNESHVVLHILSMKGFRKIKNSVGGFSPGRGCLKIHAVCAMIAPNITL